KVLAIAGSFSLNNKRSNPRFAAARYSTSISRPIKMTAAIQTHVILYALSDLFYDHNIPTQTLAKTKVMAVFGTICGWPGMTLLSAEELRAHPPSTRQETPMPMALAPAGMS